jgi:hypothetical protein
MKEIPIDTWKELVEILTDKGFTVENLNDLADALSDVGLPIGGE